MSIMSLNLSSAVRQRLDQHLDEVDAILREQALPRSERTVILDELADQVLEILTGETSPEHATPADLQAVLDRLDPPAAYATKERPARDGRGPTTSAASEPAFSSLAVLSFILAIAALVLPWFGVALGGRLALAACGLSLLLAIAAPVLGFLRSKRSRASNHARAVPAWRSSPPSSRPLFSSCWPVQGWSWRCC